MNILIQELADERANGAALAALAAAVREWKDMRVDDLLLAALAAYNASQGPEPAGRGVAVRRPAPRDDCLSGGEYVEQRSAAMDEPDAPAESADDDEIDIVFPPVQRKGYVEQTHKTYARKTDEGEHEATAGDASRRGTG